MILRTGMEPMRAGRRRRARPWTTGPAGLPHRLAALALLVLVLSLALGPAAPAWGAGAERVPGVLSARTRPGEIASWWASLRLGRVPPPLLAVTPERLPVAARPEAPGRWTVTPDPPPRPAPVHSRPTPRSPPPA
jgi:hypothetical protein